MYTSINMRNMDGSGSIAKNILSKLRTPKNMYETQQLNLYTNANIEGGEPGGGHKTPKALFPGIHNHYIDHQQSNSRNNVPRLLPEPNAANASMKDGKNSSQAPQY